MPTDAAIHEKLDALTAQVAHLVDAERRRSELFEDLTPVLRQMLGLATTQLGSLEERGYFAFGRGLLDVLDHVVQGYSPEDIEELGRNVVTIIDAVRALTQPHMMALANDVSGAVEAAEKMKPLGVIGVAKAASDEDAQQGMAVLVEALRRLGKGVKRAARRESLNRQLGSRRHTPQSAVPRRRAHATAVAEPGSGPVPPTATAQADIPAPAPSLPLAGFEGVERTPEGFLVDHQTWTPKVGEAIAKSIGVNMTDTHWRLIHFARQEYESTGMSPNIRRLTSGSGLSTKEIYGLFPKAPGKCTAMIAGLPKPVGCI